MGSHVRRSCRWVERNEGLGPPEGISPPLACIRLLQSTVYSLPYCIVYKIHVQQLTAGGGFEYGCICTKLYPVQPSCARNGSFIQQPLGSV